MDVSEKYRILASGKVLDHYNPAEVKSAFSTKFGVKPNLVDEYFNGRAKVIKKNLNKETAQKYKAALVDIGVDASIEKMEAPKEKSTLDTLSLVPIGNENSEGNDNKKTTMVCPKCGLKQANAVGCKSCGIIIEKYESAQLALQQTTVIHKKRNPQKNKASMSTTADDTSVASDTLGKGTNDGGENTPAESKNLFSLSLSKIKKLFLRS